MRDQHREQGVFLARQQHRLAGEHDLATRKVHAQAAIVEQRRGVRGRRLRAQQDPDPRHQLGHAERLGHVVVGAGIQRRDFFRLVRTHGQHQHRHLRPLADFAQGVEAIAIRQTHVQHHHVRAARGQCIDARLRGVGKRDRIALRAQADLQEPADLRFVVDHQHARGRGRRAWRHRIVHGGGEGSRNGKLMRRTVPRPSPPGSASTSPPCAPIMPRQIARPRPVPWRLRSPRSTL